MKKLIVITSPLYIRNYIETDAFKDIIDEETFITCTENINNKSAIVNHPNFVGEFGLNKTNESLFYFITLLLMYSNRSKSKGFYFYFKIRNVTIFFPSLRLKRKAKEWCSNTLCQSLIIRVLEVVRPFLQPVKLLKFLLIITIDFLGLTNNVVNLYKNILPKNKELILILDKVNPDLILIPNGGLDPYTNDVIFSSRRKSKSKVMLLIDNWDNMCSKSRFVFEPDYLCVWGRQAKGHAERMHDFDSSKIFLAGTPRFDVYYKYLNENNNSKIKEKYKDAVSFPYILFAGCWPAFDEMGVLEILDGLIDKYKDMLPAQCKILYRPHPWGENYDKLNILKSKKLKNIEIDPQMSKNSRPDDYTKRTDFQPELDYYPILLDNSEFVICPLSSVIIEASIMNKKVLALAHEDGKSFLTPAMMYRNSDYFDRLSDLKSLKLLRDLKHIDELFYQMIKSDDLVDRDALNYYIVEGDKPYCKRIASICNQLSFN